MGEKKPEVSKKFPYAILLETLQKLQNEARLDFLTPQSIWRDHWSFDNASGPLPTNDPAFVEDAGAAFLYSYLRCLLSQLRKAP